MVLPATNSARSGQPLPAGRQLVRGDGLCLAYDSRRIPLTQQFPMVLNDIGIFRILVKILHFVGIVYHVEKLLHRVILKRDVFVVGRSDHTTNSSHFRRDKLMPFSGVALQEWSETSPGSTTRSLYTGVVAYRFHDVQTTDQIVHIPSAFLKFSWTTDDQGYFHRLFVRRAFSRVAVVTGAFSVVGSEDKDRIVLLPAGLQSVQ